MSLMTKVFTAAFYSFCFTLWLMTTSELFKTPTGTPLLEESSDLSGSVKKEVEKETSPFILPQVVRHQLDSL